MPVPVRSTWGRRLAFQVGSDVRDEIGRASGRGRGEISVVDVSLKKKDGKRSFGGAGGQGGGFPDRGVLEGAGEGGGRGVYPRGGDGPADGGAAVGAGPVLRADARTGQVDLVPALGLPGGVGRAR